jgi:hypothetical protein
MASSSCPNTKLVIRRKRKEDLESANFPTMTLAEYEILMESENGLAERLSD